MLATPPVRAGFAIYRQLIWDPATQMYQYILTTNRVPPGPMAALARPLGSHQVLHGNGGSGVTVGRARYQGLCCAPTFGLAAPTGCGYAQRWTAVGAAAGDWMPGTDAAELLVFLLENGYTVMDAPVNMLTLQQGPGSGGAISDPLGTKHLMCIAMYASPPSTPELY